MDEKIRHQLKIKKVREMKNPTILMHTKDFEAYKTELESTIQNFKVGENPTYQGIPVKTTDRIDRGTIFIYDNLCSLL